MLQQASQALHGSGIDQVEQYRLVDLDGPYIQSLISIEIIEKRSPLPLHFVILIPCS